MYHFSYKNASAYIGSLAREAKLREIGGSQKENEIAIGKELIQYLASGQNFHGFFCYMTTLITVLR